MSRPDPEDYLAICETKARYCRCLDQKDWAGYGDVFTEDAILDTRGAGGQLVEGRAVIVQLVRSAIGEAATVHQVHSPEIALIDEKTATVIWAMQDRIIWDAVKAEATGLRGLTGYGHYRETCVRCADGTWQIARSELTRLHMETERLDPSDLA